MAPLGPGPELAQALDAGAFPVGVVTGLDGPVIVGAVQITPVMGTTVMTRTFRSRPQV